MNDSKTDTSHDQQSYHADNHPSNDKTGDSFTPEATAAWLSVKYTVVFSLLMAMIGVAAAGSGTDTSFCDINFVGPIVNAGFSIFVGGALALGLLTWVATSFTESLPLPQDTKQSIKQQRNSGIASALRAIFVPALVLALLSATSVGIPDCITIFSF